MIFALFIKRAGRGRGDLRAPSPAASQTQTQTTLLAHIRCCLSWQRCGRRGKAAPCKRSRPFAPAAFPPLGGEPWLAMNSTKSQPWPSQRPAPPGAGHPRVVLGGTGWAPHPRGHPAPPWQPERGHTTEPPAGKSLAGLVWVWGCGASWQAGECLALDKSFAHRSLVSLEMPPSLYLHVLRLFVVFLLCATERKPFRQTLKPLAVS